MDSVRAQIGDRVTRLAPGQALRVITTDFPDGLVPLRLTAYASSGTGSIAAAYGREQVVAEITRVAAIDNAPPQPVAVRTVSPENGMLRIQWERYPRFNFQAYRVFRTNLLGGGPRLVATINDRNVTTWSDPQFIGGDVQYHIDLVAGDGSRSAGPPLGGSFPPPAIVDTEILSSGRAQVRWSATRFPGALGRYDVIDPGSSTNVDALYATTQDTVATFSVTSDGGTPPFGSLYELAIQTWSQPKPGGGSNSGTRLRSGAVEVSFDPASGFSGEVFAVTDQNTVYGIDATTRQPSLRDARTLDILAQSSLPGDAYVWYALASPSGRPAVIYSRSGRYYGALLNPTSLAVERGVALEPFIGAGAVPDVGEYGWPALTNDGVLFYGANFRSSDYIGPTVVGVDLVAAERVATFGDGGAGALAVLDVSEDGEYVMLGTGEPEQLLDRDATDPSGYRPISGPEEVLEGVPWDAAFVGPSRIAILVAGFDLYTVQTLDLPSLTMLKTFALPGGNDASLSYDPASDRLASVSDETVYLTRPTGTIAPVTIPTAVFVRRLDRLSYAAGTIWGNGRTRRIF